MRRSSSILALLALTLSCCASQTALPRAVRSGVQQRWAGQVVELRQSCFYGDLYADNTRWLLSPHAFDHVHHLVGLDGRPIHPENQRGVVRAGTRFRIERIEFPDVLGLARRMLTTPRYNPWIYLRPVDPDVRLPNGRHGWVLLLPRDLETAEEVEQEMARLIAPQGEVRAWLAERRPTVRVAIEHKDLVVGMTKPEMVAAMGEPRLWIEDQAEGAPAHVAWFGPTEAWLTGEQVVAVRAGRPASPPAAR